jgi:hypothetical protein
MSRYRLASPMDMGKLLANKALLDPDFNLWIKELTLSGYDPICELNMWAAPDSTTYRFFILYPTGKRDTFVALVTHREFYEVWWCMSPMGDKGIKTKDLETAMHIVGEVIRNGYYEPTAARDESST